MESNNRESVVVKIDFDGKEYSLEAGKFAKFANGSVMVKYDDTMVLVTAVASDTERTDIDFLPLQVEYREKKFICWKNSRRVYQTRRQTNRSRNFGCKANRPPHPTYDS